ncbi:MAG: hypothetical protein AAF546_07895 [Verrucomicrobiota bacterium]
MNSNGHHFLQDFDGWLDVNGAIFGRPWTVTLKLSFLFDRNSKVLMPSHWPILFWRLVEEDTSYR